MKRYAGIGARDTPDDVLATMRNVAQYLGVNGYTLRSGGARGADTAFAQLANSREIIKPNDMSRREYIMWSKVAEYHHAAWDKCTEYAKQCHARNAAIIMGRDLDEPVDFVVCWTSRGRYVGGTGLAMHIAKSRGIDIFNLATDGAQRLRERLAEF